MRTWIIGSGADCDLVVARPTVSGRHCRLIETSDGYLVEDLGSSNGTYVNGVRIASATRISVSDAITLGLTAPMPWPEVTPAPGVAVIRVGRLPDNDVVLDDARVSGHHARLIVTGDQALIEDLGSSNGTFVNSPDRRVTQPIPLTATDVVYFGSLAIPAAQLLAARPETEQAAVPPPRPVPELAPVPPSNASFSDGRWAILLLAQAPLLAILIVLISGRQAAVTTFAMAISSIWLSGSLAVWASVSGRHGGGSIASRLLDSPGARLVTLVVLGITQCAVLLAIVHAGSGLRGDWPAMFGVLVMASATGLLLGLLAFSRIQTPAMAVGVLLLGFVPMVAFGGWIRPLAEIRPIAALMPSRWAFEGLLLLESDRHPLQHTDLAEAFFPADSERMGPTADATALGCMLVGLTAALVFISAGSKSSPRVPSGA
jgi:pSer/pThr/pTyr-binding forkhead associated (FHA) protein